MAKPKPAPTPVADLRDLPAEPPPLLIEAEKSRILAGQAKGAREFDELAAMLAHAAAMPGHSVAPVLRDASVRLAALRVLLGA